MAKKSSKRAETKPSGPSALIEPGPAKIDEGVIKDITITAIRTDDRNDRLITDDVAGAELATSMRERGLLEPIVVGIFPSLPNGAFLLVAGHRRLAAAKRLKWDTIRAVVRTYRTDEELQLDRAVENVHRLELNPVEESYAVAGMIDAVMARAEQSTADEALQKGSLAIDDASDVRHQAQVRKRAIEIVAGQLGKSVTWVNDRAYLSRLSGKARQLVLDGRLPLTYAREICKVADPDRRDELASDFAAGGEFGALPGDFDDLKFEVGRVLYSLAQVPWNKSVPFAGAAACDACPHNSANQPRLFEHVAPQDPGDNRKYQGQWKRTTSFKEPEAGVCTHEACFKEKAAVTNRQLSSKGKMFARRIGELAKKDRPEITAKKLADAAPSLKVEIPRFLDPNKLVARVKDEMTKRPTNKTSSGGRAEVKYNAKSAAQEAKEQAEDELYEALQKRQEKIESEILKEISKDPLARVALAVVQSSTLWIDLEGSRWGHRYEAKKAIPAASKPGIQQLINLLANPTLEGLKNAGSFLKAESLQQFDNEMHAGTDVVDRLAKAMGLTVPPRPTLAEFMPKEAAEKVEEKAKPEKAAKAKGRKSTKSADLDDEDEE